MANTSLSSQIYTSRSEIKNQIIEFMQQYLELENVDLTKSSFLSFMVEVIAILTSNVLFYQSSSYREFYLTKAQLPSSILDLSAFLGYNVGNATAATAGILITIPFGFVDANTQFTIAEGHRFYADEIQFKTTYTTTITVVNNSQVTVTVSQNNRVFNIPVQIGSDSFAFSLAVSQLTTDEQEFKIDEDLQPFQFVDIDVPLDGQVASLTVEVQNAGDTSFATWTEFSSLYLMDNNDQGYVSRRSDTGLTISFGNGLIGVQPPAGGLVNVTTQLTQGADGNVIAGSIVSGDRIYNTTNAGITQVVDYTVVNTSAAINGDDEESLEEIRSNAITNLTALERTVTENDYKNLDVIIDDSPIAPNSLPVLKRSDLKANEIVLFTTLTFNGAVVPTRNAYSDFTDLTIPRNTIVNVSGTDYYTIFDMQIDPLNTVANYEYITSRLEIIPTLQTTFDSDYDLIPTQLTVRRSGASAIYELSYTTTETDTASCIMSIVENNANYVMTNDTTAGVFTITFPNLIVLPSGELTYRFTISDGSSNLASRWQSQFTFRKDLSDFSLSNVSADGTSYTIYDIPVIKKSYYDSISQTDFESQILQTLISTVTFEDYRMLTDFINLKFANTDGQLTNMQLNPTTETVIEIRCDPPTSCSVGDTYIVGTGTGLWKGYDDYFAVCSDATNVTWTLIEPDPDQIILNNDDGKVYIYSDLGWVVPIYNIPLKIVVDVFKSPDFSGSINALAQDVKNAIYNNLSSRFGINATIYRSEIYDIVQEVDGVQKCKVVEPESSIFFSYELTEFTQEELLKFGPDYIYFTLNDITVRAF